MLFVRFAGRIRVTMEKDEIRRIGGYLLSAMDMEESLATGVYLDYMARENWPADADEDTYEEIKSLLKILTDDSTRHGKIFFELKDKLSKL